MIDDSKIFFDERIPYEPSSMLHLLNRVLLLVNSKLNPSFGAGKRQLT